MTAVRLHIPDEPIDRLATWRGRVDAGTPLDDVVLGEGGVVDWYWSRWQALASFGLDRAAFTRVAEGYLRELALWLRGERTHVATASGLLGRVTRRLPADDLLLRRAS